MTYLRRDVVLVRYPDSNLQTFKRRPALVVQATNLSAGIPQTVLAMITSKVWRAGHPSRVLVRIEQAPESGLMMNSVVLTDNLNTVQDVLVDRVLGVLRDLRAVDEALRRTLGLFDNHV